MILTFQQHLEQHRTSEDLADLPWILSGITLATKMVEARIRRAGLENLQGSTISTNVHGEVRQKLDVYANEALLHCLGVRENVFALVSEENDQPITLNRGSSVGKYVIVFDPLDGSSNIDVNINVGTIFSIYRCDPASPENPVEYLTSPGANQVAAGYVLYGPSTELVYTAGSGVHSFTLDPSIGAYILSRERIEMPAHGKYYSFNDAQCERIPSPYWDYIHFLRMRPWGVEYSARYVGSLVADFHRTLLKGGVFLYPPTDIHPSGKLRLLYEAKPLSFIAEQAGGRATDGNQRILSITPEGIHQRIPFIVGSSREMAALGDHMRSTGADFVNISACTHRAKKRSELLG
jgi:fructose-1,6-bisphosphatase I